MPIDIMYVVAGLAALLFICVFTMSYIKAAPDEAIIVSGIRKEPRVIIGRAGFRIPFFERADHLSLQLIQIDVKTGSPVPTKDYINVSVDAVVTAKISDNPDRLKASAQNFLNKKPEDIRAMIVDILEGNMREIVGRMQLVDLVGDRKQVSELVLENAIPDLEKLGIVVQTFNIQNFEDANGVIENLGVDKTSAIRKAAAISKANAERDISVAQSQAKKEANDAAVAAELEIAQKQNDLAVKKANLQKISDTEKAIADAAYEIQKQTQQKEINVAQAEAEVAKQEKEIEIRERMVAVTEKELQAQIQKKAEAERQAQIQRSEADLFQQQKDAEAERYKEEQRAKAIKQIAEAEKEKAFAEAEATKAKAMEKVDAWVQKYADGKGGVTFDAVVAANDQMALGAVESLKGANILKGNNEILISGIDGTPDGVAAVAYGYMVQTVLQDAAGQAKAGLEAVDKIMAGEQIPGNEIMVPFVNITQDNVADFQ